MSWPGAFFGSIIIIVAGLVICKWIDERGC